MSNRSEIVEQSPAIKGRPSHANADGTPELANATADDIAGIAAYRAAYAIDDQRSALGVPGGWGPQAAGARWDAHSPLHGQPQRPRPRGPGRGPGFGR
ncbi:MAG: hypothetical protein M3Y91_15580 [Actinomycetota bacterium]|nr:hypothetical protein [Actinomycetota bacterium]